MKHLLRFILFPLAALKAVANPTGLSVQSGAATAVPTGSTLNITASQNAFLNWQSFNIAAGERTVFNQPSANSIVWNKINDANPSQIYGSLQANGVVVLMNQAGFYFGPHSFVSAAGLVVSTANCLPPQNGGGAWEFNGPPPLASIVNYGRIQMGSGGSAFLIADQVENHGDIEAPGGSIGLAAGQTVMLNERPDGRGLSMAVTLPQGSVNNSGNLVADGGIIALQAKVVNQNGLVQADSVREQNGQIELVAADALNLGATSQIRARGDQSATGSPGGTVTLKSDNLFSDAPGSQIVTTGGPRGGNGGDVEVSAPNIQSFDTAMDASAAAGSTAGQLLLDPININLVGSGTSTTPAPVNGTVNESGTGNSTLTLNVNTAFKNKNFSTVTLEASGNITMAANLTWDLSDANNYSAGTQLNLLAGGNISLGSKAKIKDEHNWSVTLKAGYNFTTQAISAANSISLTSSSLIQTANGNIILTAGNINLPSGSLVANTGSGGTTLNYGSANVTLNPGTLAQLSSSSITLATSGNLTLDSALDLFGTYSQTSGQFNLLAGGNIIFGSNGYLTDQDPDNLDTWAVTLKAGYNFTSQAVSGSGSIYLNGGNGGTGGGSIQTAGGNIDLEAGTDIQIYSGGANTTSGGAITATAYNGNINISGPGYLSTSGGGDVTATAVKGSVYIGASATAANISGIDSYLSGFGSSYLNNGSSLPYYTGIATGGGDVKIVAGGNIYSYLPTGTGNAVDSDPGSGAFGPGNVTLIADGNITGHYQLYAGSGNLYAGYKLSATGQPVVDAKGNPVLDANGNPILVSKDANTSGGNAGSANTSALALSLTGLPASPNGGVASGWNVQAEQSILLQEVRNPQGVFGDLNGKYTFNYAPDSYVDLTAGNQIQFGSAQALPRLASSPGSTIPIILPPTLNATAGNGGILLAESLTLFPSAQGSLQLTTLNGGPLAAAGWDAADSTASNPKLDPAATGQSVLLMSDADPNNPVYTSSSYFSSHAAHPLHSGANATTVALNISGDMGNIVLKLPEAATVNVVGSLYNVGFVGQNINANDTTTINVGAPAKQNMETLGLLSSATDSGLAVGGDILNFNEYQLVYININNYGGVLPDLSSATSPLNLALVNGQWQPLGSLMSLINLSPTPVYDQATGKKDLYALSYQGPMDPTYKKDLSSLKVTTLKANGQPELDSQGNPVVSQTVQLLTPADAQALYNASQLSGVSTTPGIFIGGGGNLVINANNVDLGSSPGIQSVGPGIDHSTFYNAALNNGTQTAYSSGTSLLLNLQGDLTMFSSMIDTLAGGNITVVAGGGVTAGTTAYAGPSSTPIGIYSVEPGDVTVIAQDNVEVAGSRVAAYNGGNVTVRSETGTVDAGSGGSATISLNAITFANAPSTVEQFSISGGGFIATTLPPPVTPGFPVSQYAVGNILVEAPNGPVTANQAGVTQISFDGNPSPNATVLMLAGLELMKADGVTPMLAADFLPGYKLVANPAGSSFPYNSANLVDANNNPVGRLVAYSPNQNVDVSGFGVIAKDAVVKATGDVNGLVFANNADISAKNNINITLVASGQANVSAGNTVSGTIVGLGGISASGGNIEASLLSQNVNASGGGSGEKGFSQGTAANSASQGMSSDTTTKAAKTSEDETALDDKKKKGKGIALAQKVSRVTVLLPSKN